MIFHAFEMSIEVNCATEYLKLTIKYVLISLICGNMHLIQTTTKKTGVYARFQLLVIFACTV